MKEKQLMIQAMKDFYKAYATIVSLYEDVDGIDLNTTEANNFYPFQSSFDDYNVHDWVFAVVAELEGEK